MCNLGEGIRERTAMETAAGIIANIMKNNKVSFEEAFASIFMPNQDKESIRSYVKERLAVK